MSLTKNCYAEKTYSRKTLDLSEGYGRYVNSHLAEGWKAYIITFMFNQIRGSSRNVSCQMENEVQRVYATSLTRIVRKPKTEAARGKLPIWIVSPDFPVPKHAKKSLREVTLNDGRHMQGIALIPPDARLREGLDDHFKEYQTLYVRPSLPLRRVHAEPITHRPVYATQYVQKALRNGRATGDDILILPRTTSELGTKAPTVAI